MAFSLPTAVRNAKLDALIAYVGNAGILRIYSGTVPASANAALSGNTVLAELTCGSPFAPAAASGVLTANAITQDTAANATGTAAFFRLFKSDGTTVAAQGTVGTTGADVNLNTVSITLNGPVSVTSLVWTEGNP